MPLGFSWMAETRPQRKRRRHKRKELAKNFWEYGLNPKAPIGDT
jgi:hypothetical protein